MSELTRGEFRGLITEIDQPDIMVIASWLKNVALPRFGDDFVRAVDEIDAAFLGVETPTNQPQLYKMARIASQNEHLGAALGILQYPPEKFTA